VPIAVRIWTARAAHIRLLVAGLIGRAGGGERGQTPARRSARCARHTALHAVAEHAVIAVRVGRAQRHHGRIRRVLDGIPTRVVARHRACTTRQTRSRVRDGDKRDHTQNGRARPTHPQPTLRGSPPRIHTHPRTCITNKSLLEALEAQEHGLQTMRTDARLVGTCAASRSISIGVDAPGL
jgi:hypothetical protein